MTQRSWLTGTDSIGHGRNPGGQNVVTRVTVETVLDVLNTMCSARHRQNSSVCLKK